MGVQYVGGGCAVSRRRLFSECSVGVQCVGGVCAESGRWVCTEWAMVM